ncbi:MAG: hypothetical protein U9Q20_00150 [Campylobacterota bacterium]|nr:hypothetical protein [Campylobacterota bacterium]
MKNVFFIILISFILIGCNQSATSVFKKDPIYAQNLQYTKLIKVLNKDQEIEAIVNITYLNSVNSKKYNNNSQNFLVGIYKEDLNTTNYMLTMNELLNVNIKAIDKDSVEYKNIAFKNNWAEYYIYTFVDLETKVLTLKYFNPNVGKGSVSFEKE